MNLNQAVTLFEALEDMPVVSICRVRRLGPGDEARLFVAVGAKGLSGKQLLAIINIATAQECEINVVVVDGEPQLHLTRTA